MRIIFSRKGFDSENGKIPSPIFPDGKLLSLPILSTTPKTKSPRTFWEIKFNGTPMAEYVRDLSGGRLSGDERTHFDPDLDFSALPRAAGWHPMLGQVDKAQAHLAAHGVECDDMFLFYGWFREVEIVAGRWCFNKIAPHLHVIFGWLQIGEGAAVNDALRRRLPWATYHPHFHGEWPPSNTLYIAADRLSYGDHDEAIPGGGIFRHFSHKLQLTAPGRSRSHWLLPKWLHPDGSKPPLSYHANPKRWQLTNEHVLLSSVGRGQEFVLQADRYPEAQDWLRSLFQSAATP